MGARKVEKRKRGEEKYCQTIKASHACESEWRGGGGHPRETRNMRDIFLSFHTFRAPSSAPTPPETN